MDINFYLIEKYYPISFNKYVEYKIYNRHNNFDGYREWLFFNLNLNCFCDFTKFFDNNGIITSIYYDIEENCHVYYIYDLKNKKTYCQGKYEREIAQEKVIYKAFEIMENQNE